MGKIIRRAFVMVLTIATLFVSGCNGIINMGLPSGTPIWARTTVGGTAKSLLYSVAFSNDAVYSCGIITEGILDFGNNISAFGQSIANLLLVKYSISGSPIWAKNLISADSVSGFKKVIVSNEGLVAVGFVGPGAYDFGNSVILPNLPNMRFIIVKFSINGEAQWVRTVNGPADSTLDSVAIHGSDIYAVGYIRGTGVYDFGDSIRISGGNSNSNPIIVKYNVNGICQWAKTIISGQETYFSTLAINGNGIYIAGTINGSGSVDFGNSITLSTSFSGANPLIVKYNTTGDAQWARTTLPGSTGDAVFEDITADSNAVFTVGSIIGTDTFAFKNTVRIKGIDSVNNCVIVKYDLTGNAMWARTVTSGNSSTAFHGVLIVGDSIFACGSMNGYSSYGFGNNIFIDAIGVRNPILVKYNNYGNVIWARSIIPPITGDAFLLFNGITNTNNTIFLVGAVLYGDYNFGNSVSLYQPICENGFILEYKK